MSTNTQNAVGKFQGLGAEDAFAAGWQGHAYEGRFMRWFVYGQECRARRLEVDAVKSERGERHARHYRQRRKEIAERADAW